MVPIMSLWLPILLSAVAAFVASFIIHSALRYHRADFRKLPDENGVLDALQPFQIPSGDYFAPFMGSPDAMKDEELIAKVNRGPVVIMTVMKNGMSNMGAMMLQWFLYCALVGLFAAYITGRALGPGAEYLEVFRFASTTAFAGFALALMQGSIWYRRSWGFTLRGMFDGLIFALISGGIFGWLWP